MQVEVKVVELLEILEKNREEHQTICKDAMAGWHKQVAKAAEKLRVCAEEGRLGKMSKYNNPLAKLLGDCPENHTEDYDSAIGMLKMAVSETIQLKQEEYRTYVMDEWDWKEGWTSSTSSYSSSSVSASTDV